MIEPNMATMLGFLTTDATVPPRRSIERCRSRPATRSTPSPSMETASTNDSLFALASGAAVTMIDEDSYPAALEALLAVSRDLALGIVRGEGATKVIAVNAHDARSRDDARRVARTIVNSPLVKTPCTVDPNWGRIVAAAGRSVIFDIDRATVHVGGILLFENGLPHDDAAPQAGEHLKNADVRIDA